MIKNFKQFIFESYSFDYKTGELRLQYSYDGVRDYEETVFFELPKKVEDIDRTIIDNLCFYTFIIAGTSYYKSFLAPEMVIKTKIIDYWQADFFNMIYSGGLGQFLYENNLKNDDLAKFSANDKTSSFAESYSGAGILLMQSGGMDSLLSAELLKKFGHKFVGWHLSSTGVYPKVLDKLKMPIAVSTRKIDNEMLAKDVKEGAYNGHVPFSAIFAGFALIQAALLSKSLVVASNESSADEANIEIDGVKINHQFSKTFQVELAINEYLKRHVSEDIHYGSILRPLNGLQVAKLFAKQGWKEYRHMYSSCNLANYKQGQEDGDLSWDGNCPKCANTFLMMAPFVEKNELLELFNGKNLLQAPDMVDTYKQLLGLSDIKPFECVGTYDEMNEAYRMAVALDKDYENELFEIRDNEFKNQLSPYQKFFDQFVDYSKLI